MNFRASETFPLGAEDCRCQILEKDVDVETNCFWDAEYFVVLACGLVT